MRALKAFFLLVSRNNISMVLLLGLGFVITWGLDFIIEGFTMIF